MLESGVLTDASKPSRYQSTHLADATRARVDIIHRRIGDQLNGPQRRTEQSTAGYRQLADATAGRARSLIQGFQTCQLAFNSALDWLGGQSPRSEKSGPLISSVQGSGKSRASRSSE